MLQMKDLNNMLDKLNTVDNGKPVNLYDFVKHDYSKYGIQRPAEQIKPFTLDISINDFLQNCEVCDMEFDEHKHIVYSCLVTDENIPCSVFIKQTIINEKEPTPATIVKRVITEIVNYI